MASKKTRGAADRDPVTGRTTRTQTLLIRVTPTEQEEMRAAASEDGLGLGPWLRRMGMGEVRKRREARSIRGK